MKLARKYPRLGSSVDADKISLTIKGVGIGLIPIITIICQATGFEVLESDLVMIVNAIATIASAGSIVYGLIRKMLK